MIDRRALCLAFFSLTVVPGFAVASDCSSSLTLDSVAPGVYAKIGKFGDVFTQPDMGNVSVVVGSRCVAVIDTGASPEIGREVDCAIQAITPLPVCYVVVTHHHPDHSLGSAPFKAAAAEIIGHALLPGALVINHDYFVTSMTAAGHPMEVADIIAPDRTLPAGASLSLDLGARTLQVQAHPLGHSSSDVTVFDDTSGTLILGDLLFVDHVPVIDGSARGWLEILNELQGVAARQAIPGHGPVVPWPEGGQPQIDYLRLIREQSQTVIDAGGFLEDAYEQVGVNLSAQWQRFDLFHKRNVGKAFTELEWE